MLEARTEGRAFTEMVETEVDVWRDLEQREDEGPRSRRPTDEQSDGNDGPRWSLRRSKGA